MTEHSLASATYRALLLERYFAFTRGGLCANRSLSLVSEAAVGALQ
jgi:hypothetical protein